jgi:regulator of replication initiation timing
MHVCPQRETTEAYLQAQRVNEDQERQIATLQSTIDATTAKVAKLEQDVKTLDEQCALWRAKVRHRHRALQMPQFAKSKKGQKEKEQWMKQKALDDSLGALG